MLGAALRRHRKAALHNLTELGALACQFRSRPHQEVDKVSVAKRQFTVALAVLVAPHTPIWAVTRAHHLVGVIEAHVAHGSDLEEQPASASKIQCRQYTVRSGQAEMSVVRLAQHTPSALCAEQETLTHFCWSLLGCGSEKKKDGFSEQPPALGVGSAGLLLLDEVEVAVATAVALAPAAVAVAAAEAVADPPVAVAVAAAAETVVAEPVPAAAAAAAEAGGVHRHCRTGEQSGG